jgi:hypothetical protein
MASSNPWDHDVAKSTGKPATPSTRPRSRADDWPSTPPGPSEPFPSLLPSRRSTGVLQRRAIRVRRAPRLLLRGGRVFRLAGADDGAWYSGDRPRFCHDREHSISTVDRVPATCGRDSGLVMTGTAARASQLSASGHSRVEDVVADEHDRVEPLMITTARSKLFRGRTPSAAPGPRWASV